MADIARFESKGRGGLFGDKNGRRAGRVMTKGS